MTPQQALDFLFQMTTSAAVPLTAHMQARQAHQILHAHLNPQPAKLAPVKAPDKQKEAKK